MFVLAPAADASIAYGSLNNFDCVNDTGFEAHGFDIELDDLVSTSITYTYDYNHYGVPKITQDNTDPAHPKVFVRYAATRLSDGSWSAFTAIPSGPIGPTDGHQFTNPSTNFGGEHFGVGYYGAPSAVKYNWLIDDGTGNLVHGPPVNVATPTFTYYPPAPLQPAVVQAVIVPPPPPQLPPLQFGDATWVKDIKTTTHNTNKVELTDLIDPDPDNAAAHNWANGEPAEVETEWRILQADFTNTNNAKGVLAGVPQELPGGDETVTRRYEFYKYTGPFDAESGEAMADTVAPDGLHGVGTVTYNDHFDAASGEWVTVTNDLSTNVVVGDFIGAQMAGFNVVPVLGLIDHIPDGELNVPCVDRTVVVPAGAAFQSTISSGSLPPGTTLGQLTGVFSGTPTAAGVFTFTVDASDTSGAFVSKAYTVTISGGAPVTSTITTRASPAAGGSTTGDGVYDNGTHITVVATHNPDYAFVNWTDDSGAIVSVSAVYPFTVSASRTLVANFARVTYTINTSASPPAGGTTSGGGTVNSGDNVTVVASTNSNYAFVSWTEGGTVVSSLPSYTFVAAANRTLVANFVRITFSINTSASPAAGGSTSGGGIVNSGDIVSVAAAPNANYDFVNWTEGAVVVSPFANYSFVAGANRTLVANFVSTIPILEISSVAAARVRSKVDVTITIRNSGGATASAVTISAKKDATLGGKATAERAPIVLGNIVPGGNVTATLTFAGVKAGAHIVNLSLTHGGGTTALSAQVLVP